MLPVKFYVYAYAYCALNHLLVREVVHDRRRVSGVLVAQLFKRHDAAPGKIVPQPESVANFVSREKLESIAEQALQLVAPWRGVQRGEPAARRRHLGMKRTGPPVTSVAAPLAPVRRVVVVRS